MVHKKLGELDKDKIQEARNKWDMISTMRKRKISVSFDEMLELVFSSKLTQQDIAKRGGVSRQRINQLIKTIFTPLLDMSGMERAHKITGEKTKERRKKAEKILLEDPVISKIVNEARKYGYTVNYIPTPRQNKRKMGLYQRRLLINGVVCAYHSISSVFKPRNTERTYFRLHISPHTIKSMQACILYSHQKDLSERFYVFPCDILLEAHPNLISKPVIIYIPTSEERKYKTYRSLLNHENFKDAWHLLSKK